MSEVPLITRGRPPRGARPIGASISELLVKVALSSPAAQGHRSQTAKMEAVIAHGLEVERAIGSLPMVSVPGDKKPIKVNIPPTLWDQFSNPLSQLSITDRLISVLYHGLGLHTDEPAVPLAGDQLVLLKTG